MGGAERGQQLRRANLARDESQCLIRRELRQRDKSGRARVVVRYKVRYRDRSGKPHSETKRRLVDAARRQSQIQVELASSTWRDPRRGEVLLSVWAAEWVKTRHDLRAATRATLETRLRKQVLPTFGTTSLIRITNTAVRRWVDMLDVDLSAATVRKAVFALRQCLEAAVADNRLILNPAASVPLPPERSKAPRFLSQAEVEQLVNEMPHQYEALVLVGAYAGLWWGRLPG